MLVVELLGTNQTPITRRQIMSIVRYTARAARGKKIEIRIVADQAIKKFNKLFRNKNKPTDVLSFAWGEALPLINEELLGTLIIAPRYIKRQASEWQVSWKEEFTRSLAHGLLHLLGADHTTKPEAKKMFNRQEKIVARFK
ncbi:MAG: rRNA maturation RNase YbeY [Candidatus Magasanikbacteria bacterium]|nr:rRNA maturation RNase YbeY [Candidatus Magasanikbacteria bacterium]